jgi:PAS domain S-box-containing protein
MKRLSRLKQLSGVAVLCFIFASAGYMMYLVYSQYRVQESLQKSFMERNLQESEKKSLSIGYFLSERLYDLTTLAESREFSLYYENQALGMSMEYGLGASVNAATEMLNAFRSRRLIDGHPIFTRLLLKERSGNVLFDNSDKAIQKNGIQQLSSDGQVDSNSGFSLGRIGEKEYLIISSPFLFKGRLVGSIIGWIPVELVHRHFIDTSAGRNSWSSIIAFGNRFLFGDHDPSEFFPDGPRPDLSGLKPGIIKTYSTPYKGEAQHYYHAFITPVQGTPLRLFSILRADNADAGKPPEGLFYILGGIGLALLAGGVTFIRLNTHAAVLETRLDETRLREKIVEEKNASLRKLQTALEQSSSSVVITDRSGSIEYVNPHFCLVTGYSAEEIMGKNPRFYKSGKEPPEKYREMWETVLSGRSWSGEFLNRKKNGELFWEKTNVAPVVDEYGVITNIIAIKDDITEQKRADQELRAAKIAAEAASRAKSEFLANMSHEIRTPMNGIIGMTELCLTTGLGEEQRLYLSSVRDSAANLLDIINDILDFSKIEAGKIEIERTPFQLRTAVGHALRPLAARAAVKGIEVLFNPAPETPDALLGDPGKLKQVIVNLVGNAVKFTERGEVLLSVSVAEEDEESCLLKFTVKDTGIGIATDRQEAIFEAFEQGDISTTKSYGGTGLGLSITKKLVELMGGGIELSSEVGVGSTFTYTARFNKDLTIAEKPDMTTLAGRKVLVVDDVAINRRVIAGFLEQWGVESCQAENAGRALELLRESHSSSVHMDFILVDVQMPECDGWQLIEEIRKSPEFDSIKCILMPSAGQIGDNNRCRELRIDGYLPKPIVHFELFEMLSTIITAGPSTKDILSPVTRHRVLENRSRLSILVAEDVEVNRELIRSILTRYGHEVTIVNNGTRAVESWLAGNGRYDLILMDVQMPVMDGLQATGRIRELEKGTGRRVPIVAMTAYAMKGDREMCIDAGMNEYISKPFRLEEISELLERYAGRGDDHTKKGEPDQSSQDRGEPAMETGRPQVFNLSDLLARIGGNRELVSKFVSMFVKMFEESIPELERALSDGDHVKSALILHKMKGATANIGADSMHSLLIELNEVAKRGEITGLSDCVSNLSREYEQFRAEAIVAV